MLKELFISAFIAVQAFLGIGGEPAQEPTQTFGSLVPTSLYRDTTSGFVRPLIETDGIRWPSLANLPCVGTNADGDFQAGTCSGSGGGGGAHSTSTAWGTTLYVRPNNATDIYTLGYDGSGVASSSNEAEYVADPIAKLAYYINGMKLGIGTTSPYAALSVVGETVGTYFTATGTRASTFPYASSTGVSTSYASSTIANFGTLFTGLSNGFAYIGSGGKLNSLASSSILLQDLGGAVTDAQVPDSITVTLAGTATALAANGANCSAGSFPLGVDASGAVESCTDAWTEAENTSAGYVAGTRTLTVAGTANQITSSAGAQDLTANRTWTLSIPSQFNIQQASTTVFSALWAKIGATASTTIDTAGNVVIPSGSTLTITGTSDGCANFTSGVLGSTGSACGSGGGSSAFEIATTSDIALSQVAYINKTAGRTTLASVATSSVTINAPLTSAGTPGYVIGGSGWTLDVDDIGAADLASADFGSFTCNGTTCSLDSGSVSTTNIVGGSTNTVLQTNGADIVAWSKLDLANQVTGTLPIANGGTATTTGRYQGLYFFGGDVFRQASTTGLLDYDPTRQLFTTKYSSSTDYASFVSASSTNLFLGTGQGALYTGSGQRVNAVATSTPTVTAPITYSGTLGQFLGGSSGTFDCTSANGSTKGCITSTDWTTFNNKLGTYDAFSHTLFGGQAGGNFFSATTSMMAIGTSTAPNNLSALTVSSSTASQLALSAGLGNPMWTMRNAGGNLYFSTTTVAGTATSSVAALSINANGFPTIPSLSNGFAYFNSSGTAVGTTSPVFYEKSFSNWASTTPNFNSQIYASGATSTLKIYLPRAISFTAIGGSIRTGTSLLCEIGNGTASSTRVLTTTAGQTSDSVTLAGEVTVACGSGSGNPDDANFTVLGTYSI